MDTRTNKTPKFDPVLDCKGVVDDITVVHLRPYADEKAATAALALLVGGRSVEDIDPEEAHKFIAVGFARMVLEGCAFLKQDAQTQRELVTCLYGSERYFEVMGRGKRPDFLAMVAEALPRKAA